MADGEVLQWQTFGDWVFTDPNADAEKFAGEWLFGFRVLQNGPDISNLEKGSAIEQMLAPVVSAFPEDISDRRRRTGVREVSPSTGTFELLFLEPRRGLNGEEPPLPIQCAMGIIGRALDGVKFVRNWIPGFTSGALSSELPGFVKPEIRDNWAGAGPFYRTVFVGATSFTAGVGTTPDAFQFIAEEDVVPAWRTQRSRTLSLGLSPPEFGNGGP